MSDRREVLPSQVARRHALLLIASAGARATGAAALVASLTPGAALAQPGKGRGKGGGRGKHGSSPSCLVAGTLIRTPDGDVPVESLKIGDLVLTADRGAMPVKWVGRQSFRRSPGRSWV